MDQVKNSNSKSTKNIVETAIEAGSFTTLAALLKDKAKLKSILTYHVARGHLLAKDLLSADLKTVEGSPVHVTVSGAKVQVNNSHVTKADIVASNGVIHVIDAVLLPKDVKLMADAA
jgi:uncharacterized surface protein with fasciclin (FAS1) repeats